MKIKCSFSDCDNEAEYVIGWGFSKGTVPVCEECLIIYQNHLSAIEKHFREIAGINKDG